MTTTITAKGQVTIPKRVRDAVGINPGDRVIVRPTASGGIYVGRPDAASEYEDRVRAVAKRRLVRGAATDEIMEMTRGEVPKPRRRTK